MRVRLTDQALVAVSLARRAAAASGHTATVADLLAALAAEPDGAAGRRLRERATAAAVLVERAPATAAPPLDLALRAVGAGAPRRAAGTADLLDASLAVGGEAVADLLTAAGYDRDVDGYGAINPYGAWDPDAETYGLGSDPRLAPAAARVVAQVRAAGGGAVDLLLALSAAPPVQATAVLPDAEALALAAQRGRGQASAADWDRGLDTAVEAAARLAEDVVGVGDLLRAVLVAGGSGPARILDQVRAS